MPAPTDTPSTDGAPDPKHTISLANIDRGTPEWRLRCHHGADEFRCYTETGEVDPLREGQCVLMDWWGEYGIELVDIREAIPALPIAVEADWNGDSWDLTLAAAGLRVVPEDRPAQCPTWIDQTKFGPGEGDEAGNCMQAAVASLLGMPLDEVPHFAAVGVKGDVESWWDPFVAWCREHGYHPAIHEAPVDGALGLMSGPSPRGVGWHCVVSRGPDVAHDHHPSRDGLALGDREWWYLIPLKPAGVPALDDDTRRERRDTEGDDLAMDAEEWAGALKSNVRNHVTVTNVTDTAELARLLDRVASYLGGTER